MILTEYLTAKELSRIHKVSPRHIRNTIEKLQPETSPELIWQDKQNRYMVHHILSSKFKPSRKLAPQYYALTIDPPQGYNEADIHKVMQFVAGRMDGPNLEMSYTVESKKATGGAHIHCYINCHQRRKLIEAIRLGFSNVSYHEAEVFDLDGWIDYMTKTNKEIVTIKK